MNHEIHEAHEKAETLAEIVAEMRRFGQRHWMHDEEQDIRLYADRIEAAAKRERAEIEANALAVGGVVEAARHKPDPDWKAICEQCHDGDVCRPNFGVKVVKREEGASHG